MKKIKLFIASSIDGYIADENNNIEWLTKFPNPDKLDYGYHNFIKTIDKVVMGRKTYEEILKFGVEWHYKNCITYVVTSNKNYKTSTTNTVTIDNVNQQLIDNLKNSKSLDCWIVGGSELIASFFNINAIDEMTITYIPIMIGKGKKLFTNSNIHQKFNLTKTESFKTNVINLTYNK